ncbi:diguanylate cyclase/phosphodiesterase (GGDEF & EAL domains) with PAS/PAC sensor(s) [hydrothermal vent metagenome]|uniref:Diguanylate cyclase/phosphodiesterase (GGDEF & EAL domains) with PAS/PAC sensor(S) n=1 Tax=hydrothermal vent metagenome TaxID=652676 RepID=A0A3B0Z181_9ZZZZ
MQHVLLIEVSATLRHLALTVFRDYDYKVTVCASYTKALHCIDGSGGDSLNDFDAVIFGWPDKSDPDADELIACLSEQNGLDSVVIVLAHEADPAKVDWVTHRPKTAMVLWDDYRESVTVLETFKNISKEVSKPIRTNLATANNIQILFVDDSPTVRVNFRRLLKANGYEVSTACSVADGYEKALQQNFDLAIIDYFMPDGTGDVLCAKLRDNPDTTTITCAIITGTYHDKVIKDSLYAGAVECMFKNEADELFLARIDSMSRMKRILSSVQKDHKRLEGILASVGDGVYGVNIQGEITFINPAALSILGYEDSSNLIGKIPCELFYDKLCVGDDSNEEECELSKAYGTGKQLSARELVFKHTNGQFIDVECTLFPLKIDGVLEGSVVAFRDVTVRKLLEDELKWQATHDSLTKLANRYYFEEQLKTEVSRLKRCKGISALLFLDLDRFKYINDTAGHAAGDKLLLEVGQQLSCRLRSSDTLARIGGDEFAIVLRNIDTQKAYETADIFRGELEAYRFIYEGKSYVINVSIGIAMLNSETTTSGEALANADLACFIAKGKGRNNTHMFVGNADEKSLMDKDLGWSVRLREAIDNDLFILLFQPIVPLATLDTTNLPRDNGILCEQIKEMPNCSIKHNEVLLRLKDSRGRLISPDAFLPTAERFNMMNEVDRWVIKNAVKTLSDIQATGADTSLAINISAQTLEDKSITDYVKEITSHYNVSPHSLVFEITESSAIENLDAANRLMSDLKSLGCTFALDDFGRGFCSFSHLKYIPVEYIKIDGIFVRGVLHDPIDRAIVNSVVQIAHSVGRKTIAEYVESVEVVHCLKEMGVDYIQGYYISRPKEAPENATQVSHTVLTKKAG